MRIVFVVLEKKTDVTTITMLRSSNVLFRGRSIKFDFHIIFMIIVLVISCWSKKIFHFIPQFFILSLFVFTFIGRNWRQIFISTVFFNVPIYFIDDKVQRKGTTCNFYLNKIFGGHVSNVMKKNIFVWLFICHGFVDIKIFILNRSSKK